MPEPTYLQAASVETILGEIIDGHMIFKRDGTVYDFSPDCEKMTFNERQCANELLRRFAALEAERDKLKSFARAHENWEAALLNDDEAWRERSLPALTQTLWDAALALQYMRNEALGKSHTTEASHDDE